MASKPTQKKGKFPWNWLFKDDTNSDSEQKEESNSDSNISKAKQVIREIESIIQQELAMMSEDITTKGENKPNSQRSGPQLIRQLHKKKSKMVLGEMEYDPVRNIWIGNEKELLKFQRITPALIANISAKDQVQVIGDMVFDPVNKVWRGNEKELAKFKSNTRPALITQLNPSHEPIEKDGMIFDPELMIWRGNEEDMHDIFKDIEDSEGENGFAVGKEFILSPEMIKQFRQREKEHNETLQGWFGPEQDTRRHLYAIRNMSIIRIINQAKGQHVRGGSAPPMPSSSLKSQISPQKKLSPKNKGDKEEDWDDVEISKELKGVQPKLSPSPNLEEPDWDLQEESQPHSTPVNQLNKLQSFIDSDEDWKDVDIENSTKLNSETFKPLPPISKEEILAKLELSENESKEEDHFASEEIVENKEEWEGLVIPQGTQLEDKLRSLSQRVPSDADLEPIENWDSERVSPFEPKKVIHEEEWNDVVIPEGGIQLKTPIIPSGETRPTGLALSQSEDWSGIDFSKGKLTLRTPTKVDSDEEEDWDDVALSELPKHLNQLKPLPSETMT